MPTLPHYIFIEPDNKQQGAKAILVWRVCVMVKDYRCWRTKDEVAARIGHHCNTNRTVTRWGSIAE